MVSCSPLDLLTGGGPNVAANVQAGQENSQTIGVTNSTDQTIVRPQARDITQTQDDNRIKSDKIDTINTTNVPWWVLLLLILGWLLPSPGEMGRSITNLFKRNRN